ISLDDFVRSEVTYASIELLKGETGEVHRKASPPFNRRDNRSFQNTIQGNHEGMIIEAVTEEDTRTLQEEQEMTRLRNPSYRNTATPVGPLSHVKPVKVREHRDYHQEKGHYTNDFIQLRMQSEMALESGKLNHLVKNVRQRGRGSHGEDATQPAMIINVISVNSVKDKKRKPLIIEAEVEGYLVRRVYVDEQSSVEVMFEHSFENLNLRIKARLKETQTHLVGFAEEISKPLDNIEDFTWEPSDITGVSRQVIEHMLNANLSLDPVCQKRRTFLAKKIELVTNEVAERQKEDEEKMAFYTDQGTYCYTKMPFGLKNARATYQRLVDSAFQSQIERNLEAYVDDMVIKSRDEKIPPIPTNEAERNYAPMEKLALSFFHVTRRLRRDYNIMFMPRNSVKGQVMADFLSEAPEEEKEELSMNQKADVLSKLASVTFNHLKKEVLVEVLNERSTEGQKYAMESGVLFKKGNMVPMLRVVGPLQANYVIREIHMGSCGMCPRAVVRKAVRQEYYWPRMHEDAQKELQKCDSCQIHAPVPRLPKNPHDVHHGPMAILPMVNGHPKAITTGERMFGFPRIIVMENRTQLVNDPFKSRCESDPRVPLILGRPFLRIARALIDVHGEEMILRDGDERLTLNMKHDTASYSNYPYRESGCTFLSEELPDIDSFNDLHPHFDDDPLSGSTIYSANSLLEEFTD
nr:reverse transcriptase domain-containing protein [Tanacetum cinerariifolium]